MPTSDESNLELIGTLFGSDTVTDMLYRIDTTTGVATPIGALGAATTAIGSRSIARSM